MGHGHFRTILIAIFLLAVPLAFTTSYVHLLIKEAVFLDVDGDSIDEIVMFTYDIVSTYEDNYIIDLEGNLKGFSYEIEGGSRGVPLPDRVDIDGDGSPEYLNITSDGIVVSDENGTVKWKFNKQIANATASDLDHDGNQEIIYIRPKQYPDTLGMLDSRGNLKFEVNTYTLLREKSKIRKEKEYRYLLLKTLVLIVASFTLTRFSSDARNFLKPNKQKIGMMLFFSLFFITFIGRDMTPRPVLIVLTSSITEQNLGYFSTSAYSIFGAYLLSCILLAIFGRDGQSTSEDDTKAFISALIFMGAVVLFWVLLVAGIPLGGMEALRTVVYGGILSMFVMSHITLPLFILVVLYYIAKMIRAKFRRS